MQTQFNLKNGKNRALVFYIVPDSPNYSAPTDIEEIVESVFADTGIEPDEASAATLYRFAETKDFLNIALRYGDAAKRLKVGGTFDDVCVGVYFYDRPVQPVQPEPEVEPDDETTGQMELEELEVESEICQVDEAVFEEEAEPQPQPEPAPIVPDLVCAAFCDLFNVYGASALVIPSDLTAFVLEVE